MAKLLKILGRTIGLLVEWLLIGLILLLFLIRTSPVQTYFARIATDYLSHELNVDVQIDKVSILFPSELAFDGLLMKDEANDTLFAAKTLFATISNYNLTKKKIELREIELNEGYVHLKRNKDGFFNYQFIKDRFNSKKKKKSNVSINVDHIVLSQATFKYDDERYPKKNYGVDYFHLAGTNIDAVINDIYVKNRTYIGTIESFSLHEKSGFDLNNFNAQAKVSEKGAYLSELNILTDKSTIYSPLFNMLTEKFTDFRTFVDDVKFDAIINSSTVSLEDIALFAPVLKGMNDQVNISTLLKKEVKNLRLEKLIVRLKDKTHIEGTINIPDYRNLETGFFQEKIEYAYVDLAELRTVQMPESYGQDFIQLEPQIQRLKYIKTSNTKLDGFYSQFVIATDRISTQLGALKIDNGIMFTKNEKNGSYFFEHSTANEYDVKVEKFNLGNFVANKSLGLVDGTFFLSGEVFSSTDIHLNSIEGSINRFDYLNYAYTNIKITEGKLIDDRFEGKIDVQDDNIDLTYTGIVDFEDELHLNFSVEIQDALLDKLNITSTLSKLSSIIEIDLIGSNPNNFRGSIEMNSFKYEENEKIVLLPSLQLAIDRGKNEDLFRLNSEIIDAEIIGKLDFSNLLSDLEYQISKILPALRRNEDVHRHAHYSDNFFFNITVKEASDFLNIFSPELRIASNANIKGHFLEKDANFLLDISSEWLEFRNYRVENIDMRHSMDTNNLAASYHFTDVKIKDTSYFSDVFFSGDGSDNLLHSNLSWGQHTINESSVEWDTKIMDWTHFDFTLEPSYISLKELKWNLLDASNFNLSNDTLTVKDFLLSKADQSIALNGISSKNDNHRLNFNAKNIILEELSQILGGIDFSGELNATGYISNPFSNLQYVGEATIDELYVKNKLVGDVNVESRWIKSNESIALQGDLFYKNLQTFNFIGDYYPLKKKENLDFNLFFNNANIEFANAFFSPDLVTNIKGLLNGTLKVTGSPDEPNLEGTVQLNEGGAKIGILGTSFVIDGPIQVDKYGFYINGVPVFDEEGNAGKIIGSVYHNNFADFNFDLMFDIEDDAINKNPENPWVALPLEKFLVLKTDHVPGDPYYGTAYATGIVNIYGYTDNLEIMVDLQTRKGTIINIPMYGVGDIDEENFIVFMDQNRDTALVKIEPKLDFTGVSLDLNFKITNDAVVKLIFDEEIGDEITAKGEGNININLNNIGDITMDGVYTVKNGVYDFAMGPIKQKFFIEEGGSINWTGDPYDAILDLKTFYRVNANIATLTNDQFASGSGSRQQVLCYLNLSESLNKPAIDFDIVAPNANDIAKSVITRIKSDPDELNRQFFSLLLWRRFQPLAGSASADGSAAIDLFANQINALLSKISSDYQLNVDLNSDQLTGDNSYEFGVKKGFLDDRLILSGSFGVENQKIDESTDQSYVIGDVNLEYLLNKNGTFRVNIFNESNDKTIIQNQDQGTFTQGAGLSYKEDFNTVKDFKAIQYFLDIFRRKKNKRYPIKRKRRQVLVPKED